MPQCPQCQKPLRELVRRCPSCQADLDLLVDYVNHSAGGLERAETLLKSGELGQAVWAYLTVLEVDPDNAPARKQVSQVATAVRQFDLTAPGRKWLREHPGANLPRSPLQNFLIYLGIGLLVIGALIIGFVLGNNYALSGDDGNKGDDNKPVQPAPGLNQPRPLGG
jgi:hypothetical protein